MLYSPVSAQSGSNNPFSSEAIKIDPVSRRPDKPIPFDKTFTLVITTEESEQVTEVYAYEVEYRKWQEEDKDFGFAKKGKRIRDVKMVNGEAYPIPGVGIRREPKQKMLIIEFPALPPNFHFDFAIIKKPHDEVLKTIRKYTDAMADSLVWGEKFPIKLYREFYDFQAGIDKKIYPGPSRRFLIDHLFDPESCCDEDKADCRSHFDVYHCLYLSSKLDSFYRELKSHKFRAPLPPTDQILAVGKLLSASEAETDLSALALLRALTRSKDSTSYFEGIRSIQDPGKDPAKFFDLKQRSANLDSTIAPLRALRAKLEMLALVRPADSGTIFKFAARVDTLIDRLKSNSKILAETDKNLNDNIAKNAKVKYSDWYISTTEVRDLTTQSGYIFTPQIGLSVLGTRSNENNVSLIPKLNWGVNINFRPIDKLISRKYLTAPPISHYLSLHVGLTMGGFREKEYENLYANTSLLVGPSLRITRILYGSAGFSLYRQRDNNPLINKYRVTTGFYSSLLLDLDITAAIATIRNSLFK